MLQQESTNPWAEKIFILHVWPPLRTAQSAGWPPEGDRTSSVDSVESSGHRCGQDRSRVAGAIAGRPDRSDTMQAPDGPRPCGDYVPNDIIDIGLSRFAAVLRG